MKSRLPFMKKTNLFVRSLLILIISLSGTGCTAISVSNECVWADVAPDLTSNTIETILSSDLDDDALAALNRLDNWVQTYNQKVASFCE
tara:strand:- start:424 stop:690 length:267 start_codon:yes stop_codon:yes gene_type:complete